MIIRKLRQDRGWSQEDLADISGLSVRTIQRVENGGRASLETLKCLAAVFETDIPNLRKDSAMTDDTAPADRDQPEDRPCSCLSAEDRAALRYVRQLRRYDDWDEDWDEDWDGPDDILDPETRIRRQVRRERHFWANLISYGVIIAFLALVNLLTSPGYLWFLWAALGWGIALVFHALDVFGPGRLRGDDWERREVERRLARLARK